MVNKIGRQLLNRDEVLSRTRIKYNSLVINTVNISDYNNDYLIHQDEFTDSELNDDDLAIKTVEILGYSDNICQILDTDSISEEEKDERYNNYINAVNMGVQYVMTVMMDNPRYTFDPMTKFIWIYAHLAILYDRRMLKYIIQSPFYLHDILNMQDRSGYKLSTMLLHFCEREHIELFPIDVLLDLLDSGFESYSNMREVCRHYDTFVTLYRDSAFRDLFWDDRSSFSYCCSENPEIISFLLDPANIPNDNNLRNKITDVVNNIFKVNDMDLTAPMLLLINYSVNPEHRERSFRLMLPMLKNETIEYKSFYYGTIANVIIFRTGQFDLLESLLEGRTGTDIGPLLNSFYNCDHAVTRNLAVDSVHNFELFKRVLELKDIRGTGKLITNIGDINLLVEIGCCPDFTDHFNYLVDNELFTRFNITEKFKINDDDIEYDMLDLLLLYNEANYLKLLDSDYFDKDEKKKIIHGQINNLLTTHKTNIFEVFYRNNLIDKITPEIFEKCVETRVPIINQIIHENLPELTEDNMRRILSYGLTSEQIKTIFEKQPTLAMNVNVIKETLRTNIDMIQYYGKDINLVPDVIQYILNNSLITIDIWREILDNENIEKTYSDINTFIEDLAKTGVEYLNITLDKLNINLTKESLFSIFKVGYNEARRTGDLKTLKYCTEHKYFDRSFLNLLKTEEIDIESIDTYRYLLDLPQSDSGLVSTFYKQLIDHDDFYRFFEMIVELKYITSDILNIKNSNDESFLNMMSSKTRGSELIDRLLDRGLITRELLMNRSSDDYIALGVLQYDHLSKCLKDGIITNNDIIDSKLLENDIHNITETSVNRFAACCNKETLTQYVKLHSLCCDKFDVCKDFLSKEDLITESETVLTNMITCGARDRTDIMRKFKKFVESGLCSTEILDYRDNYGESIFFVVPKLVGIIVNTEYCTKDLLFNRSRSGVTLFNLLCFNDCSDSVEHILKSNKEQYANIGHNIFPPNTAEGVAGPFDLLSDSGRYLSNRMIRILLDSKYCSEEYINRSNILITLTKKHDTNELIEYLLKSSWNLTKTFENNPDILSNVKDPAILKIILDSKYINAEHIKQKDHLGHDLVMRNVYNQGILEALIDSGHLDPHAKDVDGQNILMLSCLDFNSFKMVYDRVGRELLDEQDNLGETIYHLLARYINPDVTKRKTDADKVLTFLIDEKPKNLGTSNKLGMTPLHLLCNNHGKKYLELLIQNDLLEAHFITKGDRNGKNMLMLLLENNQYNLASRLFDDIKMVDLFMDFSCYNVDNNGDNILLYGIRYDISFFKKILDYVPKKNLDMTNNDGNNVYMYGAKYSPLGLKILLDRDKSTNLLWHGLDHGSILTIAIRHQPKAVKVILESDVDKLIFDSNEHGTNILYIAAEHNPESLKILLDSGHDFSRFFTNGILHLAARTQPMSLKHLLESRYCSEGMLDKVINGKKVVNEAFDTQPESMYIIYKSRFYNERTFNIYNTLDEGWGVYKIINKLTYVFNTEDLDKIMENPIFHNINKNIDDIDKACTICCEHDPKVVLLPCLHMFCQSCVLRMNQCANCRADIEDRKVLYSKN